MPNRDRTLAVRNQLVRLLFCRDPRPRWQGDSEPAFDAGINLPVSFSGRSN